MSAVDGPYVGLDCFREEDAGLFFGREAERARIIGNLRASRLTLLHAESGVGKSSLLRAGVSARLRELATRGDARRDAVRFLPVVFTGWGASPEPALIAALETAAGTIQGDDDPRGLRRDTLGHAIEDLTAAVDATLLVILDQFEDHFLYEPLDAFDDELARCIGDRDLRAHFLISVREDAYALIGQRFKARIPNVYGNFLHLDFLDERAARHAVVEPVDAYNARFPDRDAHFEVEPALVDAVIEEVRRGRLRIGEDVAPDVSGGVVRVETAYLQLVMKRLWDEELAAGSERLRRETLRRLGGAGTIVRAHLDDAMAGLTPEQRDVAAQAFRFLVTSGGRKIALSGKELAEFTDAPGEPLETALTQLERARILRAVPSPEPEHPARHELYHDVLAAPVLDWRRRHVEERRRAEAEQDLSRARERSRRLEVRSRRLAAAVIALTAAVAALGLYLWDPGVLRRLELKTIDARFAVRGTQAPDPRLAVIAVDDRTLARLDPRHTGRIPRQSYAQILDRVHADGPAVMALDVIFAKPRGARGDRALQAAIARTRDRLVLPYDDESLAILEAPDGGRSVSAVLFGDVDTTNVTTGWAGLPEDGDDHNRRANYVVSFAQKGSADVTARTFAFAAADVARHGRLRKRLDELPTASRRAWGDQNDHTTWIDYPGPPRTIPRTSALDVIDGRVPPGRFRDKLVVIGKISRDSEDVQRTPLDRGKGMSGVEIQAAALSTMVRDSPLRDVNQLIDILAIVVLGGLGALAALRQSRLLGALAVAAVALGYLAVAQIAFQEGRIVAVVLPLATLALAAASMAILNLLRAIRRRRTRSTDGAA